MCFRVERLGSRAEGDLKPDEDGGAGVRRETRGLRRGRADEQ
jgi:hypothetical protein